MRRPTASVGALQLAQEPLECELEAASTAGLSFLIQSNTHSHCMAVRQLKTLGTRNGLRSSQNPESWQKLRVKWPKSLWKGSRNSSVWLFAKQKQQWGDASSMLHVSKEHAHKLHPADVDSSHSHRVTHLNSENWGQRKYLKDSQRPVYLMRLKQVFTESTNVEVRPAVLDPERAPQLTFYQNGVLKVPYL